MQWKKAEKLVPCRTDGRLLLSGFQALLTLTLTLDRVIWHTVVHHSPSSIYTSNFIEIGKTFFVAVLSAGTPPSSRSRDTTSSSAIAEVSHDALRQLKSCQLLHNCMKNHILTRRIALSCGIKIWSVRSLD